MRHMPQSKYAPYESNHMRHMPPSKYAPDEKSSLLGHRGQTPKLVSL